jgi:predicted Zn-dependent protease
VQAYHNAIALRDARDLSRQGKTDEAIAKVTTLLQSDPRSMTGYDLRGQLYINKKDYTNAANDFQAAHLIDPKNVIINFNIAQTKFLQKDYDGAKTAFLGLQVVKNSDMADMANYQAFLCDLAAGHTDAAQKEFDAFNNAGEFASYYYANVAWNLFHKNIEEGRSWLASASRIYTAQKNQLYAKSLFDLGYLPLPPPPAAAH